MVESVSEIIYKKNVQDVSVTITDLLQGEVKVKILHKSTDINKTLIKIPKYVPFFVSESQGAPKIHSTETTGRCSSRSIYIYT